MKINIEIFLMIIAIIGIFFVIGVQIGISHGREIQLKECPCCNNTFFKNSFSESFSENDFWEDRNDN